MLWDAATQIGRFIGALILRRLPIHFQYSSGYTGPWTFSPTTLTNQYFALLFNEKYVEILLSMFVHVLICFFRWSLKKWDGPKQYEDKKTKSLMMLPYVKRLLFSPSIYTDTFKLARTTF